MLRDDLMVTAIRFEGGQGAEYWVGLPNFYVITRYNRSAMYAMAVHQLAGEIARARGVH
ncbi:Membrane-bound lytic murein transglycosylase B precursor [compost metagenome]